jgi:hypothetical protein
LAAPAMLVEAAWVAVKTPGPLPAFYERIRSRRGMQIAVVATARARRAVLAPGDKARGLRVRAPSLTDRRLRALELRAGMPSRRGQKGKAAAYSLKEVRRREQELAEQANASTASSSPIGKARHRSRSRAWPPPMGRDCQGPLRGKLRGRHQSQNLRFAPGSTTPTPKPNAS